MSVNLTLVVISLAFIFSATHGAHRDKFRKCTDIAFCRRHRELQGPLNYQIDPSSVQISPNGFVARATEGDEQAEILITISRVIGNTLRIHMTDASPSPDLHSRYLVKDVLEPNGRVPLPVHYTSSPGLTELKWSTDMRARIEYSPFRVVIHRADTELVRVNDNGYLYFENYRHRSDDDPDEWWEERFSSHSYSHESGPSSIGLDVSYVDSSHLFGLPEHASSFSLKDTFDFNTRQFTESSPSYEEPFRLYNLDVFEYELDLPDSLYAAIPFIFSKGKAVGDDVGVLWLNAAETWVDIGTRENEKISHFYSESGQLELFVIAGAANHGEVLNEYTQLTGRPQMPPEFSLGHHQCRWNYRNEAEVDEVNHEFNERNTPNDVIWLDIEHTDGKKYFSWDNHHFGNPLEMIKRVAHYGRKMVTIVDPHIKKDDNYRVYQMINEAGLWIKNKDGDDYSGWCWPGESRYPDFTNPAMRQLWADLFSFDKYAGSSPFLYTWNDMNEPSVFDGPQLTMPTSNIHMNGVEHGEVHNLYGYYVHMATFEGHLQRVAKKQRPFVLSRAAFVGTQRYGPIWTGDNTAEWSHLEISVPMLLSLSIAGLPFVGADIGGFFNDPDASLMTRWYEVGFAYPFFRNHAHHDTARREFYQFEEPFAKRMRAAIVKRYQLMPYVYTLFHESAQTGAPIMRPLFWEFPRDEANWGREDAFMFGNALFVRGVYEDGVEDLDVALPGPSSQIWFGPNAVNGDLNEMKMYRGGSSIKFDVRTGIPILQAGGTIVPQRRRVRRSSVLMKVDPFTLVVALNEDKVAEGSLYLDDGDSFEFERGIYTLVKLKWNGCVLTNEMIRNVFEARNSGIDRVIVYGQFQSVEKVLLKKRNQVHEAVFDQAPNAVSVKVASDLSVDDQFQIELVGC